MHTQFDLALTPESQSLERSSSSMSAAALECSVRPVVWAGTRCKAGGLARAGWSFGSHGSNRSATAVAGPYWIGIFHFLLFTGEFKEVFTRGDPQRRPGYGGVWNKRTGEHQN